MFLSPFSFEGRIRRSEFGVSCIIYTVLNAVLAGILSSKSEGIGVLGIAYIPMLWFLWAQGAKRCHDLGKSGFWQIIPFYGFWMLFQDGQGWSNEYGENPKGMVVSSYSSAAHPSSAPLKNDGGYDSSYDGGHNNPDQSTSSNTYSTQQPSAPGENGYKSGDLYK